MSAQSSPRFPWIAVLIAVFLALAGVFLLAFAIISIRRSPPPQAPTQVSLAPTAAVAQSVPTAAVIIPTITEPPSQADTAEPAATEAAAATSADTAAAPTAVPATTAPSLTIVQSANVRNGPGLVYNIIGGLAAGSTPTAIGRDSGGQWFVIQYGSGQGWVSGLLAKYSGDSSSLPVIAAPPTPIPPPPTATPVPTAPPPPTAPPAPPPTAAPAGYYSHGLRGVSFSIENTTAGVNQAVWFNFSVTNPTGSDVNFAVLAAHTDVGPNAQSWTNQKIKAYGGLTWRDHIFFSSTGTYQVYLGICYADKNSCLANSAPWDRLSDNVQVTIQ